MTAFFKELGAIEVPALPSTPRFASEQRSVIWPNDKRGAKVDARRPLQPMDLADLQERARAVLSATGMDLDATSWAIGKRPKRGWVVGYASNDAEQTHDSGILVLRLFDKPARWTSRSEWPDEFFARDVGGLHIFEWALDTLPSAATLLELLGDAADVSSVDADAPQKWREARLAQRWWAFATMWGEFCAKQERWRLFFVESRRSAGAARKNSGTTQYTAARAELAALVTTIAESCPGQNLKPKGYVDRILEMLARGELTDKQDNALGDESVINFAENLRKRVENILKGR